MTTRMFLSLVDLVSMIEDRLAAFGPRISNLDGGCSMTLRPPRRGNPHSPVTPPSASRDSLLENQSKRSKSVGPITQSTARAAIDEGAATGPSDAGRPAWS